MLHLNWGGTAEFWNFCFYDFMIISNGKGKQDSSWCDPFNWEWSRFIELCFGWCVCCVRGTWAILASSWSFLSLFSFCCMKSLSSVLWPCMLDSLLVRSIPLWSSFTSNKTFSRETKEYTERTHLVEICSVKLWCLSKYGLPLYCKYNQIDVWHVSYLQQLSPHSSAHYRRATPAGIYPSLHLRYSAEEWSCGLLI